MALAWLVIMVALRMLAEKKKKLFPLKAAGPIIVVILSTLIVGLGHLDREPTNIKVVGTITAGLPTLQPLSVLTNMDHFAGKFQLAFVLTIIGLIESVSISRALAAAHNYEIDPVALLPLFPELYLRCIFFLPAPPISKTAAGSCHFYKFCCDAFFVALFGTGSGIEGAGDIGDRRGDFRLSRHHRLVFAIRHQQRMFCPDPGPL